MSGQGKAAQASYSAGGLVFYRLDWPRNFYASADMPQPRTLVICVSRDCLLNAHSSKSR
jgi:hypothetical protein